MDKKLIFTAIVSFAGGWVAKCFYEKKTGRGQWGPLPANYEVTNSDNGNKLDITFGNGDVLTVEAEDVEVPEEDPGIDTADYTEIANYYVPEETTPVDRKPKTRFPYTITEEEWEDENDGYVKRHFSFYIVDGVLADENNNRLDNWRELVGVDPLSAMETFGERMQLVKNEARMEKYEILLNDGAYDGDDGH